MIRLRKVHTSVIEEKTNDLSILNTILSNYQKFLKKINDENQFLVEESKKIEEQKSAAIKSILSLQNNVDVALSRNLDLKQKIVAQSKSAIQEIAETSKNTLQTFSEGGCIQPKNKIEIPENKVKKNEDLLKPTNLSNANELIPNKVGQEKKVRFENLEEEEDFETGLRSEAKLSTLPQQKIAEAPNLKNDSKNIDNILYNNFSGQNDQLKQSLTQTNSSSNNVDNSVSFRNLNPPISNSNMMESSNNNLEQKSINMSNMNLNQNLAESNNFEGIPMNTFMNSNNNNNSFMRNNNIDIVNTNMMNDIPNNNPNNNMNRSINNNNMVNNFDLKNNAEENANGWNNQMNIPNNFESPQKFDFGMGNTKNVSPQIEVNKQMSLKQMGNSQIN